MNGIDGIVTELTTSSVTASSASEQVASDMIQERKEGEQSGAPEAPEVKKPDLSSVEKFNALARRERELQKREQELKAEREKLKGVTTADSLKERARKEPLKVMEELGLTYEELTNTILNDGKAPAEMGISDVRKELESLREELKREKEEKASRENEEKANQYRNFIKSHIKDKEDYEYLSIAGDEALDLICDTVVNYYQEHKKILSEDEACKLVEEQYESMVEKYLSSKKLRKKLGISESGAQAVGEQVTNTPASGLTKTLTNSMLTETKPRTGAITDDESSLKAAAALLRWQK